MIMSLPGVAVHIAFSGFAAPRLGAALLVCLACTAPARADPGHGVCIQGTNPNEHNQPIGYIERSCLKSPVDGSTDCGEWETDSLNHNAGEIHSIKLVKTWPRQLATDEQLDTWEFWQDIEYDESFEPGVQARRYSLPLQWNWGDISADDDCSTFPRYHFRVVGNGLQLYEGCHPDFC